VELLELHTIGLHYSEDDVKNCARLLTGRTIDDNQHYSSTTTSTRPAG